MSDLIVQPSVKGAYPTVQTKPVDGVDHVFANLLLAESTTDASEDAEAVLPVEQPADRLSYKFQRLRESLRQAIAAGTLSGRLPGERSLAKQFQVNAKTLSKALTDLAAEGLLDRTVGRGTFVRQNDASTRDSSFAGYESSAGNGRMLVLTRILGGASGHSSTMVQSAATDFQSQPSKFALETDPLIDAFAAASIGTESIGTDLVDPVAASSAPAVTLCNDIKRLRPSFLVKFTAVVDLHGLAGDDVIRDAMLRGMKVILVDRLPRPYSCHAVLVERVLPTICLIKRLAAMGHQSITISFDAGQSEAVAAIRQSLDVIVPHLNIRFSTTQDLHEITGTRSQILASTAYVFDQFAPASQFMALLQTLKISVPADVSVGALGLCDSSRDRKSGIDGPLDTDEPVDVGPPCSGYPIYAKTVIAAIHELAQTPMPVRPLPTWLTGEFVDRRTMGIVGPIQNSEL